MVGRKQVLALKRDLDAAVAAAQYALEGLYGCTVEGPGDFDGIRDAVKMVEKARNKAGRIAKLMDSD